MGEPRLIERTGVEHSPARKRPPGREPFRVGAVHERRHPDADEHREAPAVGIRPAASRDARLVCLRELTLSPHLAADSAGPQGVGVEPEELPGGPTFEFAAQMAAETGAHVHASLSERAPDGELGFNTAIVVGPDGGLVGRTRKLHIPVTAGYHEDRYFPPGPAAEGVGAAFPLVGLGEARFGLPTCWDQRLPEVAHADSLEGDDVPVHPTAIGSEPDHPEFDTRPPWERVIVADGIANGTFMAAANRFDSEPPLRFCGSPFISDPYGRVPAQAPRDEAAVLVADLDQRGDGLELFPFLSTGRPDAYARLVQDCSEPPDVPGGGTRAPRGAAPDSAAPGEDAPRGAVSGNGEVAR